jgi:hypothetical protein
VAARNYYRAVLAQNPDDVESLLGLAQLVSIVSERKRILAHALQIAPDDTRVQAACAEVERLITTGQKIVVVDTTDSIDTSAINAAIATHAAAQEPIECPVHREFEATLRCTGCNRPMCVRCVIPNEVGQLCRECYYKRIPERYRSTWLHWLAGGAIGFFLAAIIPIPLVFLLEVPFIGAMLYLAGGFLTGGLTAQLTLRIINKRGQAMIVACGIGIGLGAAASMIGLFGLHTSLMILALTILFVFLSIRNLQQQLS